jgi:hypothetical protein
MKVDSKQDIDSIFIFYGVVFFWNLSVFKQAVEGTIQAFLANS